MNSFGSDYAFIEYDENIPYVGQTTTESGLLTIGIESDITSTHIDRICLIAANGSGRVGINTKFPTYNLDVSGQMRIYEGTGTAADRIGSLTLEHGNASGSSSIVFKSKNDDSDYGFIQYTEHVGGGTGYTSTSDNGLLMIGVANNGTSASNSDRIVLWSGADPNDAAATGRVGINTKFPTSTLDVSGNFKVTTGTLDENPSVTIIKDPGLASNFIGNWQHQAQLQIQDVRGNSMVLAMSNDGIGIIQGKQLSDGNYRHISINPQPAGNVGIGNLNPQTKLDVTGTVQATSFNAGSDYRIKANVMALDASFNVDVLKPVTYTNTRHGRQDIGFIAHEVQEHYPFLVNGEKDAEQMQSLNYIGLIGILTKEIQDLKRRLAETEAKNTSIEQKMDANIEQVYSMLTSADNHNQTVNKKMDANMEQVYSMLTSAETKVASIGDTIASIENDTHAFDIRISSVEAKVLYVDTRVATVENTVHSVENRVASVETAVHSVENTVLCVENTIASVENTIASVENTVLLEQARLLICETDVALSKSAIKDLEERFQS